MSERSEAHSLRWVSWAAVSSLPQAEKVSLEVQRADNLAAVTKHGGQLVAELEVPGHTRYHIELDEAAAVPELAAYAMLRDLIRSRAFDVLVFRDISRLGRTAALCMTVVGLCQRAGIITYETANPPPTLALRAGHSDMLINAIQSVGAQHEIHRLQERHKMGMLGRVKAGNQANRAVYGYKLHYDQEGKRRMVVDEPAAAIVRQILDKYANGKGTHTIVAWLNENGLPSYSGVSWIPRMVYNILDRVWRYAGYTELNRTGKTGRPYVRAQAYWTPIISRETAERVIEERAQRNANRRLPETAYRLSGVCVCAVCGGRVSAMHRLPDKSQKHESVSYRCIRHRPLTAVREKVILAALRAAFLTLATVQGAEELSEEESDPTDSLHAQLDAHDRLCDRIEAGFRRVDNAYADGTLDDERYRRQVERLNAQLHAADIERARLKEAIEEERTRGTRRQRIEDVIAHGLGMLETPDVAAANVWLRTHVRVHVAKARVTQIDYL